MNINYSLIPYKKQDNYLYYIITYLQKDKKSFIIHYFIFNINYPNSNQIITSKIVEINMQNSNNAFSYISQINCILMSPKNFNKNLLICFYIISYDKIQIHSRAFDINNDFNEINEYSKNFIIQDINFKYPNYISVRTNKDKNKALIYLVNEYPFIMAFDLDYFFSKPFKLININILKKYVLLSFIIVYIVPLKNEENKFIFWH